MIGRGKHAAPPGGAAPADAHGQGGTDMTRLDLTRRSPLVALALVAALAPGCAVGPNYTRPEMPSPPQYRFFEGAGAGAVDRRRPLVGGHQGPAAAGAHPRGDRQQPRPAHGHRARGGGPRPVRDRPLVPVPGGRRRAAATRRSRSRRLSEPPQGTATGKTYQNCSAGFPLSWEIDLFGRIRREKEAAFAAYLATEQGRRAALVTLVATWRPPTSSCGSWTSSSNRPAHGRSTNDETVALLRERACRAASRTGSRWTRRSRTAPAPPR